VLQAKYILALLQAAASGLVALFSRIIHAKVHFCGMSQVVVGLVVFVSAQSSVSFRLRPLVTFRLWRHKGKLSETDRLRIDVTFRK
jgi:hypothetical protein